ncbi:hypothetical protein [Synechococcus elongatus]|uniref:hypothetical protein n=1 Tax=Synechococcus elongatus TaxID=32046 RepID=UPI0030FF2EDA
MRISDARVSPQDQNLALQRQALREAGCEKIVEEAAVVRPPLVSPLAYDFFLFLWSPLIEEYQPNLTAMGFPNGWDSHPSWQQAFQT